MIFTGMGLLQESAHSGLACTNYNKQVFGYKSIVSQLINDFDMGQALLIGTHFILTFDDVDTAFAQDSPSLSRRSEIQIQYGFMVFFSRIRLVIFVVAFVVLVIDVGCAAWRVHIRRVKYNTVN